MCKKNEVHEVTRSNKEIDNRKGLEWLVNAIKDSEEITWEVMLQSKIWFRQMMSNRKWFQYENSKALLKETMGFLSNDNNF